MPKTGTYTLLIEGRIDNVAVGDYTVDVQPAVTTTNPLTFGGTVNGTIAIGGDEDDYTFSVAGSTLAYMDVLTDDQNLTWTLVGPEGTVIDGRAFATASVFYFSELALYLVAGDYTLKIRRAFP